MNRLERTLRKNNAAIQACEKEGPSRQVPSYNSKGNLRRPGRQKVIKRLVIAAGCVAGIIMVIYLPQLFVKDKNSQTSGNLPVNSDAVTLINDAKSKGWTDDFDADGLDNQTEQTLGTSEYLLDSDHDNLTDYAEIYVTKTNPLVADSVLRDNQSLDDGLSGRSVHSPYKIGNVILWADDYQSKAYGSVVETSKGYRFCDFSGYAQFTLYDGWYAYRINNGVHQLLEYRAEENVWKIEKGDTVMLYSTRLPEKVQFTLFGNVMYADTSSFTELLAAVLPDKGLITARKVTREDVAETVSEIVTVPISVPAYNENDYSRFQKNCYLLSDIVYVRDMIDLGKCVAFTIFHETVGEKKGIIYGYNKDQNCFLVADPDTLEYVGNLYIFEKSKMMMVETGETVAYEYFDFMGFGASSTAGFHINFFAVSE